MKVGVGGGGDYGSDLPYSGSGIIWENGAIWAYLDENVLCL